jgi:AcrR family transcriptional regulator
MEHDSRHSQATFGQRERIVRSAAELIRRKGVSGSGMREIVSSAGAPRGSLQHYFPSGKDELVGEALMWMSGVACRRVVRALQRSAEVGRPSALLDALLNDWRRDLSRENYEAGCPFVATAADAGVTSDEVRHVVRGAFEAWDGQLQAALVELGVPRSRTPALAAVLISALEGAIVLACIRQDLSPLDAVGAELGPVLDAAVIENSWTS